MMKVVKLNNLMFNAFTISQYEILSNHNCKIPNYIKNLKSQIELKMFEFKARKSK